MIGSYYEVHPPPTPAHPGRRVVLVIAATVAALVLGAAWAASAASLRVCVKDDTSADVVTAPVFLNAQPFHPDMLDGSTVEVASGVARRCNLLPIPATLAKGQNFTTTVKYANAVGGVSPPSNGVVFRFPGDPPIPVLDSVQVVAP